MRIKNKDIANKLNISTATVSLALNNKPGISEETRQRVLKLVNEETKAISAPVALNSNTPILFIMHKKYGKIIIENTFYSTMLISIEQTATELGYPIQILNFLPNQNLDDFIAQVSAIPCCGILLLATELTGDEINIYKSLGKPIIALANHFFSEDINYVAMDNTNAIFRAVQYVYHKGHRKLGYIKCSLRLNSFTARYYGFYQAIQELHINPEDIVELTLPPDINEAQTAMSHILQEPGFSDRLPTVFICELDYLAIGAMKAFKAAGYDIPKDISFIGHDDIPESNIIDPHLTTFSVNHNNIGEIAVQKLISLLDKPEPFCTHTLIAATLIDRDSVATLPPHTH